MFLIHVPVLAEYSGARVVLKLLFNSDNLANAARSIAFRNTVKAG